MEKIAVVGLGAMGSRVARRLLDAGHEVTVWNRTPEKAGPLLAAGAAAAESPAAAARSVDAVITMVADPSALRAVTFGIDGLSSGLQRHTTLIEMSTVGPRAIEELQRDLPPDTQLVDAPVLGSLGEVEAGSLRIFVGGPQPLFDRWQPVLAKLGEPIHVGPLGAGAAAKLVANLTLFTTLGALGEAIALGEGLGLPPDIVFSVLSTTPLAAQAERRRPSVESGRYPKRFELALALKDAGLVADAAGRAGIEARLAEAARSWLADAVANGHGDLDYSSLIEHIRTTPRGLVPPET